MYVLYRMHLCFGRHGGMGRMLEGSRLMRCTLLHIYRYHLQDRIPSNDEKKLNLMITLFSDRVFNGFVSTIIYLR